MLKKTLVINIIEHSEKLPTTYTKKKKTKRKNPQTNLSLTVQTQKSPRNPQFSENPRITSQTLTIQRSTSPLPSITEEIGAARLVVQVQARHVRSEQRVGRRRAVG